MPAKAKAKSKGLDSLWWYFLNERSTTRWREAGGGGDCNHGTQKEIAPSLILLYNISKRIPAQLLFALLLVGLLIHNHWTPSAHISHQPREFSLSLSLDPLLYCDECHCQCVYRREPCSSTHSRMKGKESESLVFAFSYVDVVVDENVQLSVAANKWKSQMGNGLVFAASNDKRFCCSQKLERTRRERERVSCYYYSDDYYTGPGWMEGNNTKSLKLEKLREKNRESVLISFESDNIEVMELLSFPPSRSDRSVGRSFNKRRRPRAFRVWY